MPMAVLSNFLIYCVINAFTPGPGNILALNTVTNYGYKKGKPLFFGIFAGYYVVQILCAIFVYGVNSLLPNVMEVMKYIGAAYILWLAIHIAFSKPSTENAEQSASFLKGFMLQFVNVKIYMFGVTALTGYVVGYMSSFPALLFFELVIATIGTIATCTWTGLGILRTWKTYQKNYSYAANVSWHIIMEFIRDLYQTAFSDKFKADFL